MIALTLNGIPIDWGKNRQWQNYFWLFPPGSITDVDYVYANDVIGTKPGFRTTLGEALFRMSFLGFSDHEVKTQFDAVVARWNRTADLGLVWDDFSKALIGIKIEKMAGMI